MSKQLTSVIKVFKLAILVGVLGGSSLIALPAFSQTRSNITTRGNINSNPTTPTRRFIPRVSNPYGRVGNGLSGNVTYPYGSRLNNNGSVTTPRGRVIAPTVRVNNGNGSVTYYYSDGSRITTNGTTIEPIGTIVR